MKRYSDGVFLSFFRALPSNLWMKLVIPTYELLAFYG